jgi:hypothetical protein
MAAKRTRALEPVTATEVTAAVLKTIATAFGDRPLGQEVARQGLAMAAHEIIMLTIKEAAAKARRS